MNGTTGTYRLGPCGMGGPARPLLDVRITGQAAPNDKIGVLAEIQAPSTAEALAWYLRSRHIDPTATEASIQAGIEGDPKVGMDRTRIAFERRNSILGVLEVQFLAEVVYR